jgi:hypothetical protein
MLTQAHFDSKYFAPPNVFLGATDSAAPVGMMLAAAQVCVRARVCLCVCVCVCVCVYTYTRIYIYIHVYPNIYIYRYVYSARRHDAIGAAQVYTCICVYRRMLTYAHVCSRMLTYVGVC